jgi:hypothetical protein
MYPPTTLAAVFRSFAISPYVVHLPSGITRKISINAAMCRSEMLGCRSDGLLTMKLLKVKPSAPGVAGAVSGRGVKGGAVRLAGYGGLGHGVVGFQDQRLGAGEPDRVVVSERAEAVHDAMPVK